jgi:hypothetical protein
MKRALTVLLCLAAPASAQPADPPVPPPPDGSWYQRSFCAPSDHSTLFGANSTRRELTVLAATSL